MRIAVDGMGGDNAPAEIVKGCVEAARVTDDEIYIVGIEEEIRRELNRNHYVPGRIKIVNASQVITGEDSPVRAVRAKKDSSLVKGISLVKDGTCDFLISGGNTGAIMAASLFILGRIKGIERPAIGTIYPLLTGEGASFLVDAGANAECRPAHLVRFAHMGSIYAEKVLGIENPRVGLVNIGTEERKGTAALKETYGLLKESGLNFVGNIEARDIPYGVVDVMVCDGFTGNTILKLSEGMVMKAFDMLKGMFKKNAATKMSALMLKKQLKEFGRMIDYSEYGGAPMLGIRGNVLKIHGSSNAGAVVNAIIKGKVYVENDVVGMIENAVSAEKTEEAPSGAAAETENE